MNATHKRIGAERKLIIINSSNYKERPHTHTHKKKTAAISQKMNSLTKINTSEYFERKGTPLMSVFSSGARLFSQNSIVVNPLYISQQ